MLSVIALRLSMFILLVLSLSVHEWAHARAAWALGDDTAARQGRLTLNPLAHLDPIGSLLPLLGVPFGWAKPVPVNPNRFARRVTLRSGMMITAAAGPASNFALALICYVLLAAVFRVAPEVLFDAEALRVLLTQSILINVMLGVFNLLPLPPLDGSRIVDGVMPYRWREPWERFERYGPLVLLALVFVLPWLGFEPLGWAIDLARDWISTAYH